MNKSRTTLTLSLVCFLSIGLMSCGKESDSGSNKTPKVTINPNPYPSTYKPIEGEPTLITNVTILDGIGGKIENGSIYFSDGKIQAIAKSALQKVDSHSKHLAVLT